MIVMRLAGGLGNQMFQYAAGRALSLRTGLPLVLDRRHYNRPREHGYALGAFALADTPVSDAQLPPLFKERPLAWLLERLTGRGLPRYEEAGPAFDPAIAAINGPAWIRGYLQSERYFSDHAAIIRAELTPTKPMDSGNTRWLAEIASEPNAVSLHVRRGDYVRNPRFAARHGSCTPIYYERALAHVTERIGAAPVVFAFSDDPVWVRDNLRLGVEIRVVDQNDASRNVEDLRLMSACAHHIIANSSFSWWGAWLNPSRDKIVAAPGRWFATPTMRNPDILAMGWDSIDY